jgi:hypothetical protein
MDENRSIVRRNRRTEMDLLVVFAIVLWLLGGAKW